MFHKLLKLVAIGGLGLASTQASALTTLKQVQVTNGSQVDLLFDGKIKPTQIRTEFFNDTIQVSLTDAAVYPAKISSVNGDALTKIFAYQYAPKLVRCRITVKGKAEDYKDLFVAKAQGKILTLSLGGASDQIITQSSAPEARADAKPPEAEAIKISEAEEKALLERVLKSQPAAPTTAVTENKTEEKGESKKADRQEEAKTASSGKKSKRETREAREAMEKEKEEKPLAGGKPLPSLWSALFKLAMVIALFLAAAFAVRRFRGGGISLPSGGMPGVAGLTGLKGALSKLSLKGLGASKGRMIEVVSTHHLGPKKSITVVRIAGRTLVLGVSGESINLITQIEGEGDADLSDIGGLDFGSGDLDNAFNAPEPAPPGASHAMVSRGAGAMSAGAPIFSDLLSSESSRPAAAYAPRTTAQQPSVAQPASANSNVRAQIRSRLEGLKQL